MAFVWVRFKSVAYLQQEVSFDYSCHVGHAARVDVVHVLQARALIRRDHLHQRRGRLGTSEDETEAPLALVEDARSRLARNAEREFKSTDEKSRESQGP